MPGSKSAQRHAPPRALAALLACCLSLMAAPGHAEPLAGGADWPPEERHWSFRVLLDGRDIGQHEFRVVRDGAVQRVEIEARFDVKVLFINAYRYRHRNVETWRDGCLVSIESSTDDNGERLLVSGRMGHNGFEVDGAGEAEAITDRCVRSFAYWNPEILTAGRLLNAQTGELVDVAVDELGSDEVRAGELMLPARRYRIRMDDGSIDLWYHRDSGDWLALEAPTEGGRVLRYEPVGLPGEGREADRLAMD